MEQPVPNVSQSDVDRIIGRDFAPAARERLHVLLDESASGLSPRIILAVLKLSAGDVVAVAANLETARMDWRDVIAYAEYPAYMKATSSSGDRTSDHRAEVIRADREQYEAWLSG